MTRVKLKGSRLRVEINFRLPAPLRLGHEFGEDRRADSLVPPRPQDRHASDLAPGVQAAGTDYVTIFHLGHRVQTVSVEAVPLDLRGNVLFVHEHPLANPANGRFVLRPVGEAYRIFQEKTSKSS